MHAWTCGDFADFVGPFTLGLIFGGDELRFFRDGGLPRFGLVLGALQIDQSERDLLPIAALQAVLADPVGLHFVFADQMEFAILHIQLDVGCKCGEGEKTDEISGNAHTSIITAGGMPL